MAVYDSCDEKKKKKKKKKKNTIQELYSRPILSDQKTLLE